MKMPDPGIKVVILIGGPMQGTRFRPLSLDTPKPLFEIAGIPLLQHLIEAAVAVESVKEILILGYFSSDEIKPFLTQISPEYKVKLRYLQEYTKLGTAGGIYHFRDKIKAGLENQGSFILINGDVAGNFPLQDMLNYHQTRSMTVGAKAPLITILGTEATRQQSMNYGCIVENKENHTVTHYVEKPETYVSTLINCGVYICSLEIFNIIGQIWNKRQEINGNELGDGDDCQDCIMLENDVIMPLAGNNSGMLLPFWSGNRRIYVYQFNKKWSQVKTAGSAIYANRHLLEMYRNSQKFSSRLADLSGQPNKGLKIIGDVFIHPTAQVHESCVIGPNVSIGKNVIIGPGVRIRESIILGDSVINDHSFCLYTIVGWSSQIGKWSRVEGTPCDPNPNKPFAKMDNVPLFNLEGKLNPSITVLGTRVRVPSEVVILNSIVLPHKELSRSFSNEIIL